MWSEGEFESRGAAVHYYRRGRGRPVLLAHGYGDSGMCWPLVADALAGEYEVIAYDARGHGLSGDAGGYDPRDGEDLIALVRHLGLQRTALIGHSMGASTVAAAAAKQPGLFSCAILEDPGWRSPEQAARPRPAGVDYASMSVDEIEERGRSQSPGWAPAEFRPWAESKKRLRMSGLPSAATDAWEDAVRALAGFPVLLITADNSLGSIVTPVTAARARELCPTLEVVQLQGAGHNIRREAFEPYLDAVQGFLGRHHQPAR